MPTNTEVFVICSVSAHGSIITPIVGFDTEASAELNKTEYNKKPDAHVHYIIQRIRVYR
jgi:hypothetical protein